MGIVEDERGKEIPLETSEQEEEIDRRLGIVT